MKKIITKRLAIIMVAILGISYIITINGCKASAAVAGKSGAQLWGENCRRCHNSPDPGTFKPDQWVTVGMHMQSRALLTNDERDKIVKFLQGEQ